MENASIQHIIAGQRQFFATGKTKALPFRINLLKELLSVIQSNHRLIYPSAVWETAIWVNTTGAQTLRPSATRKAS
jgi:hypothetical protein